MNKKQHVLGTVTGFVAALALVLPGLASASNFQLTEQSVTSLGRAHSGGAAIAEDASSIWYNPAGLTNLSGSEIVGGYALIRFGADFTKTSATDALGQPLSGGEGGSVGKLGGPLFVYYSRPINDQLTFGFGLNARAALITRGLAEISRLSEALGGRRETLMGLAGMGDLILTCTGDLSRNRRVGLALAAGDSLPEILRSLGHVAEGVNSTQVAARLAAELGIDMPITRAVNEVLSGRIAPRSAVEQLMSRDPKVE